MKGKCSLIVSGELMEETFGKLLREARYHDGKPIKNEEE